jgi:outer membrane protein assembly factor BamB
VYHGDPAGSGVATDIASVNTTAPAWTSPVLDGQLYGEPLGLGTRVFVATENDTVYALDAATGTVDWSTHVGTAVPASSLPCGNISPNVGITGTPVIDPVRSEVYVVADTLVNGSPSHRLIGLSTATGKMELSQSVDPGGSVPSALLQRTGLTLDGGRVVFGFGGNYGDCGSYKGWVVSVDEAGGAPSDFAVDSGPGESQGAIWMGGGAPAIDTAGHIWVSAGNGWWTSGGRSFENRDSVLELSPALSLLQYFAPTSWTTDNRDDKDFSTSPALLSDGQVLVAGKSRIVYLLDGAQLGGIGGQRTSLPSGCGDDIDGGMAVVGMTVFVPCLTGTEAVQVGASPPSLHLQWSSGVGGGPPIVAAGLVWTISANGELSGLNPQTGKVQQQVAVGQPANHFPTPGLGAGHLLAASADQVIAFATSVTATSTTTTAAAAPSSTTITSTAKVATPKHHTASGGGLPPAVLAAIGIGAVLAGAAGITLRRRRRRAR